MSFNDYEASANLGRPIALYEFWWGNKTWKYTSADADQFYPTVTEGNRFRAVSIRDDGMTQGGSSENDFIVHAQSDLDVVTLYGDSPPTAPVWLRVRRKHADDPSNEAPVFWVGRVGNVMRLENPAEADIRGISILKLLKSGGLRLTWGKNCPHCVYDSGCKEPTAAHRYQRIVQSVAGPILTITAATIPAEGTFAGGFVEWDRSGTGTMELRGIEAVNSDTEIKVLGRLPNLQPGDTVNLYPGCDQTTSTCVDGFDNILNYGGFPFMPEKSPFDGSQVFD